MPDITMCESACRFSRECKRHADSGVRSSEYYQAKQKFKPPEQRKEDCEFYWPVRERVR